MSDILKALSAEGVSIWLDDISRDRLRTGDLEALIRDKQVVGVTSNPTIFAKALSRGDAYDEQVRELAVRGVGVEEASRAITTYDIRWAADVLRPVYDRTDGVDGRVSIEVDPRLAHETEKTVAEAKALWWLVDRPNVYIKIPATREGLPAITATLAAGISVNVTLIFSLERYGEVIDAFFAGLEQARANGHDLSKIGSVASFFVSRVDTEIDKRLDKLGRTELRGRAAVANARLAYALYEDRFSGEPTSERSGRRGTSRPRSEREGERDHEHSGERWTALKAAGARAQRPLWASTGVKDPAYPDTLYVTELVAPNTVNTMPEPTLDAVGDHAPLHGDAVRGAYDDARAVFTGLEAAGVDYDDVVAVLEDEGVEKFAASWKELLASIESELADKSRGPATR